MEVADALLLLLRFQIARLELIGHKPNAIAVGAAEDAVLADHFDRSATTYRVPLAQGETITTLAGSTLLGLPVRVEGKTGVHVEYLGFSKGPF